MNCFEMLIKVFSQVKIGFIFTKSTKYVTLEGDGLVRSQASFVDELTLADLTLKSLTWKQMEVPHVSCVAKAGLEMNMRLANTTRQPSIVLLINVQEEILSCCKVVPSITVMAYQVLFDAR